MIKNFMNLVIAKIEKRINIKLCIWIAMSLLISIAVGVCSVYALKAMHFINVEHIDYDRDRYDTEEQVLNFINNLYMKDSGYDKYIEDNIGSLQGDIYICDEEGRVKYENSESGIIECINTEKFREEVQKKKKDEYKVVYPLTINNEKYNFIMTKKLDGVSIYTYEVSYIVSVIVAAALFIALIYFGIREKVRYIEEISEGINKISKGDFKYNIEVIGKDELSVVADEINKMEKSILNMIERERKSNKNQCELITNVSHDLKTPLTIILGYLDIIKSKSYKSEEEQYEYIETVYKKAELLQKMILNLFELVKLENGKDVLNKREVNINMLLKQLLMESLPMAKEKDISMEFLDAEKTITLSVDLNKICDVFNNLMSNALKYTPEGGKIKIDLKEDEAGALICFANTCENIKQDDLDNIFKRFYRGDKARNSKVEGSGVGLSIVKKIIELHNSSIWAELNNNEILFFIRLRG